MMSKLLLQGRHARPALSRLARQPCHAIAAARSAPTLAISRNEQEDVASFFDPSRCEPWRTNRGQGFDLSQTKEKSRRFKSGLRDRVANCLDDLRSLPGTLPNRFGVCDVIEVYQSCLVELDAYQKRRSSIRNDIDFIVRTEGSLKRDAEVTHAILSGIRSMMADMGNEYESVRPIVDNALMNIFRSRIDLRLFLRQHLASLQGSRPGFHGMYELRCSAKSVAECASQDAVAICRAQLGASPEIIVSDDSVAALTCVPALLQYTLTEVFKNACRAVMERHASKLEQDLPPVWCAITYTKDDVHIEVRDQGAGISPQSIDKIWQFMYTTSPASPWSADANAITRGRSSPWSSEPGAPRYSAEGQSLDERDEATVLSGYGIGLKMSRLYAQVFGGDLTISSEHGVGTNVSIRLSRRGMVMDGIGDDNFPTLGPVCMSQHPGLTGK